MKLLRLKITAPDGFRSLKQGFEVVFRSGDNNDHTGFDPYILAGRNGSGKSNIFEALAFIFYHLECMSLNTLPDSFVYDEDDNPNGFRAEVANPDAFELEYLIPTSFAALDNSDHEIAHIKIVKEQGKSPEIQRISNDHQINGNLVMREEIRKFLPKYVLAYSSGENEILSLPFFKMRFIHFDEYRDTLTKDAFYGQAPEGRLIYLDEHFSQSILLSNLLIQPRDVLLPFADELGLHSVKQFRLIIGKHHYEPIHEDLLAVISDADREDSTKIKIELTSKLKSTLTKFERCSTAQNTIYDEDGVEQFRILDFFVNEHTKAAFRFHFNDSALELFQAFQILYTLNYYSIDSATRERIYTSKNIYLKQDMTSISLGDNSIFRIKEFRLDKEGLNNVIYTRSLSDGEHQFIHSLGLCLLFKDENCLFLLDEPETHFNPDWRAKFISCLRECFEIGAAKDVMREMLITTHSPFLISDSKLEYVLLFAKDKDTNRVTVSRPQFNTFGASINKITIEAFEKRATIGGYAERALKDLKDRFNRGDNPKELINEAHNLGDSIEKVLFIHSIQQGVDK